MIKTGPQCNYCYTVLDGGFILGKHRGSFVKLRALTGILSKLTRLDLFWAVRLRSRGPGDLAGEQGWRVSPKQALRGGDSPALGEAGHLGVFSSGSWPVRENAW